MAGKYNRQTGADSSRAAMIGRHEGETTRADAKDARTRMIERGQFRQDDTDEGQKAVA